MTALVLPTPTHRQSVIAIVVAIAVPYVLAMSWFLQQPYDTAGGVVVAHILALVTVPLVLQVMKKEKDERIARIIVAALVMKFVGTLVRFAVVFSLYGGKADASEYDKVGAVLAAAVRNGDFSFDIGRRVIGTGFIEIFTGIVYTFTGQSRLAGFLVYSWLGFWGLYFFYRAFKLAAPNGEHRRYALLVFFLPSMLFWPSSIGKEAWMTLTLGVLTYGVARFLTHAGRAWPWMLLGLVGTSVVRPHITILAVVSLMVAYLLGTGRASSSSPFRKLGGIAALALVFAVTFAGVKDFFRLEEGTSVTQVLDDTRDRTAGDGSQFEAVAARSPADIPLAVFSVLFRPLPFEARNVQALVASLEGTVLLVTFVRSGRRLKNFLPQRRAPFLTFASTYSVLFAIAFSNFANFGILVRERVQLFPFVLMLLTVPVASRAARSSTPLPVATLRRQRAQVAQ